MRLTVLSEILIVESETEETIMPVFIAASVY